MPQANPFSLIPPTGTALRVPLLSFLSSFEAEYSYAMVPNWDGCGAEELTRDVVNLANQLVKDYASTISLQDVTPGRDGSLSLTWDDGRGNYVYLDVGPGQTLHLFYDVVDHPKWEGVSVASDQRILKEMVRAFGFLRPRMVFAPPVFIPAGDSNVLGRLPQAIWPLVLGRR
jgi:hypothetical protein